jgi:hypothetical protein
MENYHNEINKAGNETDKKGKNKFFWQNAKKDEDCSNLTIARDLNISVMTIFEIDSIEMKEGFIY